ncbi:drug/metabolite transporter (DMT)-like permease [Altererythrobacter atlanticus]|uniref:DMT superfamily transporter inner membrane protein n=1 Tax=Croceibacterium atlanticum TaxID=1267766 RepID=A0A0F7KQ72_9SPHN|nr:DMT family transporter [Croceibacterium atlanticum]AKH42683.1 putative DMT superfamily transporter inner membrane protein [Croceibacterium atlanticum]MBB5731460.1 drug/metabolite transporter (DMT)-like permease [Croceibacterium atlanticum]
MQTDRQHLKAIALLGLVMLLWAGNSIVARAVRFDVPPLTLAFVRWSGACLFLLPFAWRPLKRDWPAIREHWKIVLLLGLLGVGAFNAFLYSGLQYTTATNALLLHSGIPVLVVILDRLIFGTRANPIQAAGLVASVIGMLVIVFDGQLAAALRLQFGIGDALVLGGVTVWSFYTIFLRLRPVTAPISFIAVTFAVGVIAMAPFAAWEWSAGRTIHWSPGVGAAFLYVAVLPSIVSYFIYNYAAQTVGPAHAGQAITMMPLFGALLSVLLLGEVLHLYHFVGMGFILAGVVLGLLALRGKEAAGAGQAPKLEDAA